MTELRNRIYSAAIADELGLEKDAIPRLVREKTPQSTTILEQTGYWNDLQRRAYSLTQVCRQIRKEFLPIYREIVGVRIDMRDLKDYLSTVIQNTNEDPTTVCGNISIDITSPCNINFRDTLLLHDRAPHLHLQFTHPETSSDMMSILLDSHLWPKFHAYISERTNRVVLNIYFDDFIIPCTDPADDSDFDEEEGHGTSEPRWPYPYTQGCVLHVKEEFIESWMRNPIVHAPYRDGMSKWENALGLTDRKKTRCPFRPRV